MFAKILIPGTRRLAVALLCGALTGCAPELNWREVRGDDAHFSALMPAKPATHARTINLDGLNVEMRMTGAAVDDLSFVVASVRIADASQRSAALAAMQQAMLRNIGATRHTDKAVTLKGGTPATEVIAEGRAASSGKPLLMHARFAITGDRVYQAIALGPQDQLSPEAAETFLGSLSVQ